MSAAAPAPPPLANSPRRWWALAALTLSVLIIALDGTVITVALPTLSGELGADSAQLQWINGGYLLALSVAMLPVGLLGDRYGHKRVLACGITLFGLASLAGTQAGSPGQLIAVRTVLGLAAAMIMPVSMAVLPRIFGPAELPKAIGVWTAATAVGMPVGPLVGGWLLNHFWWGSVFLFNVPVVVLALIASLWLLPADRTRDRGAAVPFDTVGTVLSALGITALVYGTILVPDDGWGSPRVLGGVLGGAVLLVAFAVWQRRYPHPLVDLRLFADPRFRWGTLVAVFVNFALMGIMFVVPQYLQEVLGHDAFGTGLRILPLIGGLMAAATLGETLVPRLGARVVVAAGLLVFAAGTLVGAVTGGGDGYGYAALWLTLTGFGFGLAVVPATSLVMSSLPAEASGRGTSLLETVQQVGAVLGVAGLGSLLSAGYLARLSTAGVNGPDAAAARDSVSGAGAVAARLHDPGLLDSAHRAFVHGMSLAMLVCAAIALAAAVLAALFLPAKAPAGGEPKAGAGGPVPPAREVATSTADSGQSLA
ncbi:DHA2 family efflux MFS transporter permease subunit [Streptomyces cocklensis]|jgi:EmrB/QacA subfamily drug resistance transporter|uniref:Drug resistance transporter, EmrB/QacA subfamily n=1 Tax=Actinacidiphila cocklensis TaxID=887465 RepID=A0A9W4DV54_9ACTN|nr:DHA2 family efflux MFS transporter permease subunit [Actinacidiphila cocklensis]MDD1063791.1 DHA2 family efflux MFS transporter permease subunit [Actinacidiphila cocklensis]CAG6396615.1 Drug resistance transporter, EmrB/QacA subfamily [Actinacidiphila cocklensis]